MGIMPDSITVFIITNLKFSLLYNIFLKGKTSLLKEASWTERVSLMYHVAYGHIYHIPHKEVSIYI